MIRLLFSLSQRKNKWRQIVDITATFITLCASVSTFNAHMLDMLLLCKWSVCCFYAPDTFKRFPQMTFDMKTCANNESSSSWHSLSHRLESFAWRITWHQIRISLLKWSACHILRLATVWCRCERSSWSKWDLWFVINPILMNFIHRQIEIFHTLRF